MALSVDLDGAVPLWNSSIVIYFVCCCTSWVYIIKDYRVRSVVTTVLLGQFQLNSGGNYRTLRTTVTVVTTSKHRL